MTKKIGISLLFIALLLFLFVFFPAINEEIKYLTSDVELNKSTEVVIAKQDNDTQKPSLKRVMVPVNSEFSIVIPKINANANVVKDVDPFNADEYQQKLTLGVAHAKGTSVPGIIGNTFLFAHSSDSFINANSYNSVFYLLSKLELEDFIYIAYEGELYKYSVIEKSTVDSEAVEYLKPVSDKSVVTLMTCWPPGTTFKRLIVRGELVN